MGKILNADQVAAMQQQAAATGKVFDINSVMAGWVDRGAWIYYDRVIQPLSGTGNNSGVLYQTYTPFSIGLNKPDAITGLNKTKLFTNLPNSGQFNPPRCLVLKRLGVYFEPTMLLADVLLFIQNAYFEFRIDDKIFFEGLLEFHPAGMGINGFSTKTGESSWSNGMASPHATRDFGNYAKYIAPLQNFSMTVTLPTTLPVNSSGALNTGSPTLTPSAQGGTGLNCVFIMDGLTDRSVQ